MLTEKFNRDNRPEAAVYHIHIYYEVGKDSEKAAKDLSKHLARIFPAHVEEVKEYDKPGGPHAVSNVAVHFKAAGFGDIVSWLQFNAQDLSILVHPKAGNVVKDHIDYGLWLGTRRDGLLNEAYFQKARQRLKMPPQPKP